MSAIRIDWRILALGCGLAVALAHPPLGFLPGLLGLAVLKLVLDRDVAHPVRSGFVSGWLAGLAYFAASVWWVSQAFMVDARQSWMAPIAVPLLAGGLALFWGVAGAIYARLKLEGVRSVFAFAGLWSLAEWCRGNLFTGLPWNLIGTAWEAGSAPSQLAAYVGVYGLTALTVFAAASASLVWTKPWRRIGGVLVAVMVVVLFLPGSLRLQAAKPAISTTGVMVRLVQANVQQSTKWDLEQFANIFDRYLSLSSSKSTQIPDLIIWPEGALPAEVGAFMAEGTWTRSGLNAALRPGQTLVFGGYRSEKKGNSTAYYNSLIVVERLDNALSYSLPYDKIHLTPFGEYLPFANLFEASGLKTLAHVGDGFTAGTRPGAIQTGPVMVQPMICYESLFPQLVRGQILQSKSPPQMLLNVSNDAWFGTSWGPIQHYNLSSYRAIETGLPIVRVTPTGISGLIDPWGRSAPEEKIYTQKQGYKDLFVPRPTQTTVFMQWGDVFFLLFLLTSLIATLTRLEWVQSTQRHTRRS